MLRCYGCGGFPIDGDNHASWCIPRECSNCNRVFRGGVGAQNCVFCLDPRGKKRYENRAGVFVALLDAKGISQLDPDTGLVM